MDTINVKGMVAEDDALNPDAELALGVEVKNASVMVAEDGVLNLIVTRAHQILLTNADDMEEATVVQIALHG